MLRRRRDPASLERRLAWIFGSPRSGSTWLLHLLVHPLVSADESDWGVDLRPSRDAFRPEAIPVNEPYIPQHLAPALPEDQVLSDALPATTLPALRHGSPNYFFSDRFAEAWRPELRRLVLLRLNAQVDRIAAHYSLRDPLVVIKEPNGSLGADFVMSLLPGARLIFLLRDGRDVVDSMVDAKSPGGWLSSGDEERGALIEREARLWLARTEAVQRAYAAHPPDLRYLVRYEELRDDPRPTLQGLDGWLGLRRGDPARADALRWNDFDSIPAEAKGRGMPLRAARPGMWRESMGAEERRVMDEVMGPKLAELGYDV